MSTSANTPSSRSYGASAPRSNISVKRGCDVCGSASFVRICEQRFATFDDRSSLLGYDVVACARCGFVYADGIPEQADYDRYYRDMSKYEESAGFSPAELLYYRRVVAGIAERLPDRAARLLDVGSAGGDALALFGKIGYTNLTGFDPSPRCAEIARTRHGLRVINTPISQMPFVGEQFDVIMLSGVLEHLRNLDETLNELHKLLSPTGAFWFGVPDARRFTEHVESPYQHFSLEHINFFTLHSLEALLARAGFALADAWEDVHNHGAMPEPVLNAVFRAATITPSCTNDTGGRESVQRYAAASQCLERKLQDSIVRIVECRTPVVVWGTGSLTLHLLTTPRFRELNIVAFVDKNANYWGKSIANVPVLSPEQARSLSALILVISYSFENEIATEIRDLYKLPNTVLKLFDSIRIAAK